MVDIYPGGHKTYQGKIMDYWKVKKAIIDASLSISSLQTDNFERTKELDEDLEYIQKKINIIAENLELNWTKEDTNGNRNI